MKKYTIKDIATMAGVSKGTVDRVLHKRGKVSKKALDKINAVLDKIDYQPNLIARNLKNNKSYKIAILLPDSKLDPYWMPCVEGIEMAKKEFSSFNVVIESYFFDPSSSSSFLSTNETLLLSKPDAVLLVPLLYKEALEAMDTYNSLDIVSSTFNNQIDSSKIKSFVGQNLYHSGRVAANLMDIITKNGVIAIVHIDEEFENAVHMQEKEKGFKQYFSDLQNSELKFITLSISSDNVKEELTNHIDDNPDLSGIFVTTSKSHQIAEITSKYKDIPIVGYDLLTENLNYLQKRNIRFLIHQNPKRQAYLGVSLLVEHLIFEKNLPKETLIPLYIINSENVIDYVN